MAINEVQVIDSHTGGEPTRVILSGGPRLRSASIGDRLRELKADHDAFRTAVINEPRGSEVLVGALLSPPQSPDSAAGVIFFNNVGYLGMCGHGAIGVAVTLGYEGRLGPGRHRLETPAGVVTIELHDRHRVSVVNVPSYRYRRQVALAVGDIGNIGTVRGDVAWGGNWFFLVTDHGLTLDGGNVDALVDYCWRIRRALDDSDIRGAGGELIDHIELCGPPSDPAIADSRNFVLCPGKAYDRSPCGTGTSARIACLIEDGDLRPGELWRQESITGSLFEASGETDGEYVVPTITGCAFVTARNTLIFDANDPFRNGLWT
jgi:4-hydroxyproline epimerase